MITNSHDADPSMRVAPVAATDHPPLALSPSIGHSELTTALLRAAGDWIQRSRMRASGPCASRERRQPWHPGDVRFPCRTVCDALAALPERPHLIFEMNADLSCLPDTVARLNALALAR